MRTSHIIRSLTAAFMALTLIPYSAPTPVQAVSEIVTETRHISLGFGLNSPFSTTFGDTIEDPVLGIDIASYSLAFNNGTIAMNVDMGADIEISYDRALLVPGATVPISLKYTPTNESGSEILVDVEADITLDCDVVGIDACSGTLNNFDLLQGSADGVAPLTGDPALNAPLNGDTLTLSIAGFDAARATITGNLTAANASPGSLPGLGGAATVIGVTGGALTGGLSVIPILEWQTAGETLIANVQVGETGNIGLTLQPVMHWLDTSANAQVNIDLLGILDDVFGDPSPQVIMSGSLGDEFQDAGLDTMIGDAVGGVAGPLVAGRVAAGIIPIALTSPALATIPPVPSLGSVVLNIDTDADNDGLSDGIELNGSNPTDPDDADSDDDGLLDGQEDTNHNGALDSGETNPNDPDSDNDGLLDGTEVDGTNPTNPLNPDSDGDDLLDGQEDANHNGSFDSGETNPNDPDTDDDELNDGLEVNNGTDPLNPDTDGDGIPDGEDVEWLQNAISGLSQTVLKNQNSSLNNAMQSILNDAEALIAAGNDAAAVTKLQELRMHLDGCGTTADNNDWIVVCTVQTQIRGYLDLLISNLS